MKDWIIAALVAAVIIAGYIWYVSKIGESEFADDCVNRGGILVDDGQRCDYSQRS